MREAEALVWAGDVVYGDYAEPLPVDKAAPSLADLIHGKEPTDGTPKILQKLYQGMLENQGYLAYLKRDDSAPSSPKNVMVMGTFDDHDYGRNNGDITFPYKKETAVAHMDFISKSQAIIQQKRENEFGTEEQDDTWKTMRARAAAGKGVYGVKVLDFSRPPGKQLLTDAEAGLDPDVSPGTEGLPTLSSWSVAIFLLDCRSHKTPWPDLDFMGRLLQKPGSEDNTNGDFLGEEQWAWFEEALRRSTASVNLIGQGLQVHSDKFFSGHVQEEWSRFPRAQHRMYQTVLNSNVKAPILVSGDVHMAEFTRRDCRQVSKRSEPDGYEVGPTFRPLFEVTTSGMTHSWGGKHFCPRPHEASACESSFSKWALAFGQHVLHHSGAWSELIVAEGSTPSDSPIDDKAKSGVQYSLDLNFGEFEFDWDNSTVTARILGPNPEDPALLSSRKDGQGWSFDTLSGKNPLLTSKLRSNDFVATFEHLKSSGIVSDGDWVCIANEGAVSETTKMAALLVAVLLGVSIRYIIPFFALPGALLILLWRSICKRNAKEKTA